MTIEEAHEVKRTAARFIEHFESYYSKHDFSRVNYCKYVIHLLLHLGDALIQCGSLISASQYWVEKYIGWTVERSNARRLAAKSMLSSALFGEAKRLFFTEKCFQPESDYQNLSEIGEFEMIGPTREVKMQEIEEHNLKELVASYFARKFENVDPVLAR